MTRTRRSVAASLAALVALTAGCSSGGVDEEAEAAFMEDRETIEVYRLAPPDGFDPEETVRQWAETLGIEDDLIRPSDISIGLDDDIGDGRRSVGINLQTGEFGGGFESRGDESACNECTDATIEPVVASTRAQELYESLGFDVSEFDWTAFEREATPAKDYVKVIVEGQRMLDGLPFGREFFVEFANGDEILRFDGSINEPIPAGRVGLLTPTEALAQESNTLAVDVPVASTTDAELAWSVSFDRFELTSTIVPVYRFPLNADLGLTNDILAIRRQDIPEP